MWMGDTLARALTTVNERQRVGGGGETINQAADPDPSSPSPERAPRGDGGGLRGVCRTLFHHCVGAIGYVSPSGLKAGGGLAVSGVTWYRMLLQAVASHGTAGVPIGRQTEINGEGGREGATVLRYAEQLGVPFKENFGSDVLSKNVPETTVSS